jgi:hypothetical protein
VIAVFEVPELGASAGKYEGMGSEVGLDDGLTACGAVPRFQHQITHRAPIAGPAKGARLSGFLQ